MTINPGEPVSLLNSMMAGDRQSLVNQLQSVNISRRILDLIAADRYRQGHIGAAEVRRMLNFSSRWETYEFLKGEKAYLPYTEEDLEQDDRAIRNL